MTYANVNPIEPRRAHRARLLRGLFACGFAAVSACTSDQGPEASGATGGETESEDAETASTRGQDSSTGASDSNGSGDPPQQACSADDECDDDNPCNGIERCSGENVCAPGEPPESGAPCANGGVCFEGDCVLFTCGDGVLEDGEQCDDGNLINYDGCDNECRLEIFYRFHQFELMPSPAASFCDRPTSALGDALLSFALASDNAERQRSVDHGEYNSLFQVIGMPEPSGRTNGTVMSRSGYGHADPAAGPWPMDGSNPIDWPFQIGHDSMGPGGILASYMADVPLTNGTFIGGPGVTTLENPPFLDNHARLRFDDSQEPNLPELPFPVADGLLVAREIHGDGDDEGFCGNIPVTYLAQFPAGPSLEDCLECPGQSHRYTACAGDQVTDECNSALDPLIGGCVMGPNCMAGFQVVQPTQPDVDHGGPAPLTLDPDNLYKVPATQLDGNLNGYSSYFRFRARRVRVTGVSDQP